MYGWGGVVSFVGFVLWSLSGDISPLLFVVPLVLIYINILLLLAVQKKNTGGEVKKSNQFPGQKNLSANFSKGVLSL